MQDGTFHPGRKFVLLIALGFMGGATFASGQEPAKPKPEPPEANAKAKVEPKAKAKQAAAKKAARKPPQPPKRPAKTVVAPTMTPADIDALVSARLAKVHPDVKPAPITGDAEFARRVHLDLVGVPPTPDRLREFVADKREDKRARLIDELLASPEYGRNWSRYWREVIQFRASNANAQQVRYDVMEGWLAEQFDRDRPWDEIVAEMIRAEGRTDENGAANLTAAHAGSPVQLAGEASRVFLGVQIQCAECHDHKSDSWKREQFHELAAFFAGARVRRVVEPAPGVRAAFAVTQNARARYTMADLADPAKTIPVRPKYLFASAESQPIPDGLTPAQLRELAASYITGQDGPWFARAYVNRIWSVLMGEGFYEMVDDIGPERPVDGEEILFPLADQWREGGYDVRWLFRTLLNTEAYQRRAKSTSSPAGLARMAAVCPSRLRADQIFEALAQALDLPRPDADSAAPRNVVRTSAGGPKEEKQAKQAAEAAERRMRQTAALRQPFGKLFGVDPSLLPEDVMGTIPQALFLMNAPIVHARTQARPGTPLNRILAESADDREALDSLYMLVLSRKPNPKEREVVGDYLAGADDRKEAFEDVYWSLINSTEFLSRR
ncbi:DUF1549 domain-containing protein [Paludisphaera sp.]|uniref:DUF1549 domain-containing protein n=1 Tax=Paludisphaera sp. TaxID=2017432 RepID=UPI00301DB1CE